MWGDNKNKSNARILFDKNWQKLMIVILKIISMVTLIQEQRKSDVLEIVKMTFIHCSFSPSLSFFLSSFLYSSLLFFALLCSSHLFSSHLFSSILLYSTLLFSSLLFSSLLPFSLLTCSLSFTVISVSPVTTFPSAVWRISNLS